MFSYFCYIHTSMNIFNKTEIKYIVIQIIAFNFILIPPRLFSYLTDIHLSQLFLNSAKNSGSLVELFEKNNIDSIRFNDLISTIRNYQTVGFIIGCLICIWITSKRKLSWINSLIVIVISFLLIFLKQASFPFKPLYLEPWFNQFEIYVYFSGCLFLVISLSLFCLSYKMRLSKT